MGNSDSIKILAARVSGLKQAMDAVRQEPAEDIGKWAAADSFAREYTDLARICVNLGGDNSIKGFDSSKLRNWADIPWLGQKSLFDTVYTHVLVLSNILRITRIEPAAPMYNLFVSGLEDAWQGQPFQIEISRCVREYTSSAITSRYGALDKSALDELKRFPCIFAYEIGCKLPPKLEFIRDVIVRYRIPGLSRYAVSIRRRPLANAL